jgi:hypothetical protein
MKPIKALYPVSIWLMRIGLLLFAYTEYFKTFSKFHLDDIQFYISAIFLIAAAIIFISGFLYKATITVLSGLAIAILSVYNIIDKLDGGIDSALIINIIIASIAIFFLSNPTSK